MKFPKRTTLSEQKIKSVSTPGCVVRVITHEAQRHNLMPVELRVVKRGINGAGQDCLFCRSTDSRMRTNVPFITVAFINVIEKSPLVGQMQELKML